MYKNALYSLCRAIVAIVVLFLSYRLVVSTLGVEQLGLWALIMPIVALIRVAELGLSAAVLKHVSSYLAKNNLHQSKVAIDTSIVTVAVLNGIACFLFYYPAVWFLGMTVGGELDISNYTGLIMAVYAAVWLNSIANVSKQALDGCQRFDLSALSFVLSHIFYIFFVFLLLPKFQLIGFAVSSMIQGCVLFISTRYFTKKCINSTMAVSCDFSIVELKKLCSYGLRFQVISMIKMFLEPLTKSLVVTYSDVAMVGHFELASRFAIYMRSLLASMYQVLVPRISEVEAKGLALTTTLYEKSFRIIIFTSIVYFSALICFVPVIELVWYGDRELDFEIISVIAILAFLLNTVSIPAYMANLGTGQLRSNIISHLVMSFVNGVFGFLLGSAFGGMGVVLAWGLALIAGTIPIIIPFHRKHSISIKEYFRLSDLLGVMAGLLAVFLSWWISFYVIEGKPLFVRAFSILFVCIFILGPVSWSNPVRVEVFSGLSRLIRKSHASNKQ